MHKKYRRQDRDPGRLGDIPTLQLALVTVHILGYLCDNIGLILAYLTSGSTDVTA